MMVRIFLLVLMAFSGCQMPSATGSQWEATLAYWTERAVQVRLGMRREEVERLLPPYVNPPSTSDPGPWGYVSGTLSGGAQVVSYYVAPRYRVLVTYDYTGAAREESGVSTRHASPDNRVLQAPTVTGAADSGEVKRFYPGVEGVFTPLWAR